MNTLVNYNAYIKKCIFQYHSFLEMLLCKAEMHET